jgi:hypothetical protein
MQAMNHDSQDLDLLAEVDRRPTRTTMILLVAIAVAVAFACGAMVQRHHGGAASEGRDAVAEGAGPGADGGFGRRPGGGALEPEDGAQPPLEAAGAKVGATQAVPVVVGTVTKVSASALTVKNLGGKSVPVKLPPGATVTLVAGRALVSLKVGATVSVAGKAAADGTVTATAVTVRATDPQP